ncbi:MAG: hypothetical protein R3F31_17830 [Verrucomicrobiales bacterium]
MTAPHPTSSQIPGLRSVRIAGTGSYLPEKVLTNNDLEKMVETSDEWITTRTGIKERRIAAEGELTSHLAAKAGLKALEMAALDPADIDMLIVSTITPTPLPRPPLVTSKARSAPPEPSLSTFPRPAPVSSSPWRWRKTPSPREPCAMP